MSTEIIYLLPGESSRDGRTSIRDKGADRITEMIYYLVSAAEIADHP